MAKHPLNEEGYTLDYEKRLELITSGGVDLMSAVTTLAGGRISQNSYNFQAWQNNLNAQLARLDAQDIIRRSYEEINQVQETGAKVRGEQRAAMSASGFSVDSGSYQAIIGETDRNIERNIAAIRSQAMTEYASEMAQADMLDIQARYERKAGKIERKRATRQFMLEGISGALKMGASYYFKGDKRIIDVTGKAADSETTKQRKDAFNG